MNRNTFSPWRFPPCCEYQYGEWLRAEIELGNLPQPRSEPDMAILLWQARKSSVSLWRGITAAVRIPPVSFQEVRKAIRDSLPGLISRMKGDERNVLLTLFRMCFTLETGAISTKDAAAEWILSRLPADLAPLARMAGAAYLGKCVDDWSTVEKETLLLADLLRRRMEGDPGMLDSV